MFPHFLCIGAQKAGTTWLYDNLKQHPGVWLAPIKEIFYFDKPTRLPLAVQLCQPGNRSLRQHTFGGVSKRLQRRRNARAVTPSGSHTAAPADAPPAAPRPMGPQDSLSKRMLWHSRFMFLPRSDRWYGSLFQPNPGQLSGDINPYLAGLPNRKVAHIQSLMPDTKIIYLIRNPVDRLWSQTKMSMREYHKSLDQIDPAVLRRALEVASRESLSDYAGNVTRWTALYGKEGVFVGFFDQLVEDPRTLLTDILKFLDLPHDEQHIPPGVKAKSNPGAGPNIPEEYEELLCELFVPQVEALHRIFENDYTQRWLDFVRQGKRSA